MLLRTFDTFDIILAPSNYGELVGVAFMLLPLVFMSSYWVTSPARVWPHLISLLGGLVSRSRGGLIRGFLAVMLVFWNLILPL